MDSPLDETWVGIAGRGREAWDDGAESAGGRGGAEDGEGEGEGVAREAVEEGSWSGSEEEDALCEEEGSDGNDTDGVVA